MKRIVIWCSAIWGLWAAACWPQAALVFLTDYGLKDGAVAAMKGVAFGVEPNLKMFDLTHEIPSFDIWAGAYQLKQTAAYWPAGTVFVCVVDPGVGTERKSIVLKTATGHFFVSPDNGTLTFAAEDLGIAEVRQIDEQVNRLAGSQNSYTFHGRDIYAYTGARLAAGVITFEQVGPRLEPQVVMIPYEKARFDNGSVFGNIPILDVQYGNIWTNIDAETFQKLGITYGAKVAVQIQNAGRLIYAGSIPFARTFGEVALGKPLLYFNSLRNVALAVNQNSFAKIYKIGSGPQWQISIKKAEK